MVATSRGPRRRWLSGRVLGLVPALVAGLSLAACTGDPEGPDPGTERASLQIDLVTGVAALSPQARDELQNEVGDVLSAYVIGAFLGDYPRDDFVGSLDSFTGQAARDAAEDLDWLTGVGFGAAQDVVANGLSARISAFAPGKQALGAAARVAFEFDVTDDAGVTRKVTFTGRLMFAREVDGWRIFGYDVVLGNGAAEGGVSR